MTDLLYYADPSETEFEARVVRRAVEDDRPAVVLDRTAFYPEGGGQPSDRGSIAGLPVTFARKEREEVVHVLDCPPAEADRLEVGRPVACSVDPLRRRDYAQQHTGQHVISAALLAHGNHNTVSVHQGDEYTTIEVDSAELPDDQLTAAEAMANRVIEEDLPVTSVWVTEAEIDRYPLRRPPKVSGSIRLIRIGDVDCVACGGVHVERTGRIRLVRAIARETIRGRVRTAWKIGDRALADYVRTSRTVAELVTLLCAPVDELPERVTAQEARIREAGIEARRLRQRTWRLVADSLLSDDPTRGRRTVTAEFNDEPRDFLRGVTEALVECVGVAACLVNRTSGGGESGEERRAEGRAQWSIGLAPGCGVDYRNVVDLLPLIGGRGGGKPPIWQGVGSDPAGVHRFLAGFRDRAATAG